MLLLNQTAQMKKLITQLKELEPDVNFVESDTFRWSPRGKTIFYIEDENPDPKAPWTLLHEFAHAALEHKSYETDIELIKLESEAWSKAKEIGQKFGYEISEDHIENCMDTYRDWLHLRSKCPLCSNHSLQKSSGIYYCFNCTHAWSVTTSRFCRPYRNSYNKKTSPSEATFN